MNAKRVRGNLVLFVCSATMTVGTYAVARSPSETYRVSMATAYASMALLVFVLALGPIKVLRRQPNPVSTRVRRDAAIWAGVLGVIHAAVGLFVHMHGKMYQYFFYARDRWPGFPLPRFDAFGFANDSGLAATAILALLLALSNDVSLRRLGSPRWKSLQRTNYVGMALIVAHGAVYQYTTGRPLGFVFVFGVLALFALVVQIAGMRAYSVGE
jgi:sulfoxide reductase heme-binding subunit YedZ